MIYELLFENIKKKFTPKKISGLNLWLRADLGITIGTGVNIWADQSGNGNSVSQIVGGRQPSYTASSAVFGGKPCVRGDGVDDVLVTTNNVWSTSGNTVFAVLASVSGGNTGEYFSDLQGGGNAALHFYGTSETEFKRSSTGPSQTLTSATKSIITYTVSGTAGTENLYLNAGSVSTVSGLAPAISNRALYIFDGAASTTFPRKYDLAELIIYTRVLSAAELQKVHNYLKGRYSI